MNFKRVCKLNNLEHSLSMLVVMLSFLNISFASDSSLTIYNNGNDGDDLVINAISIVQVNARKQGSAVVLLYAGQPVLLTNSHVIGNSSFANIFLPPRLISVSHLNSSEEETWTLSLSGKSDVILNLPAYDLALLSLPKNMSERDLNVFIHYAKLNGELCPQGFKYCSENDKAIWTPNKENLPINTAIGAVLDSKLTSIKILEYFKPYLTDDHLLSGLYRSVIHIPSFTRPGVSGGAFYNKGVFTGLITKVSSTVEAFTVAIPIEEVARILSENSENKVLIQGNWVSIDDKEDELQIHLEDETFVSRNGGAGLFVQSGGPISDGGSKSAGSSLWTIKMNNIFKNSYIMLNPFDSQFDELSIIKDNKKCIIDYFEVDEKRVASSMAELIWYKLNAPDALKIFYKPTVSNKSCNTELSSTANKLSRFTPYSPLVFGRLYKKSTNNDEFLNINLNCDSNFSAHLQALEPYFDNESGGNNNIFCKRSNDNRNRRIDSEGYLVGSPFSIRHSDEFIFDIKLNPTSWSASGVTIKVMLKSDLSEILIETPTSKLIFKPEVVSSQPIQVYKSTESRDKAVVILDGQDLSIIKSVFVETSGFLIELIGCRPGVDKECAR
jgi:hypothetical protein